MLTHIKTAVSAGAAGIVATGNITGGNISSDAAISATGNISGFNIDAQGIISTAGNVLAANASVNGTITAANVNVSNTVVINGSVNGTGIGVENIVWQQEAANISSSTMANVGSLKFTALANSAYKFQAQMPIYPEGSTNTEFAVLFDSGVCNYTLETQTTATSTWSVASSNTSNTTATSQIMTGTDMRTVRISGTFAHTGNTDVTIRAQTSAANLVVKTGAHLTYTRIG